MITSKGFAVTTAMLSILPANGGRRDFSVQNNTTGTLYMTLGGSALDADAVVLSSGELYTANVPFSSEVKMRSTVAGNVTIIGDDLA